MARSTGRSRPGGLRDAAVLAGILEGEFHATYRGSERSEYVRVVMEIVAGLGGSLDAGAIGLAATFADRQIKILFVADRRSATALPQNPTRWGKPGVGVDRTSAPSCPQG
jgi:hypothetical protein